jgi:hypothetical protein
MPRCLLKAPMIGTIYLHLCPAVDIDALGITVFKEVYLTSFLYKLLCTVSLSASTVRASSSTQMTFGFLLKDPMLRANYFYLCERIDVDRFGILIPVAMDSTSFLNKLICGFALSLLCGRLWRCFIIHAVDLLILG